MEMSIRRYEALLSFYSVALKMPVDKLREMTALEIMTYMSEKYYTMQNEIDKLKREKREIMESVEEAVNLLEGSTYGK